MISAAAPPLSRLVVARQAAPNSSDTLLFYRFCHWFLQSPPDATPLRGPSDLGRRRAMGRLGTSIPRSTVVIRR